ncbi:hypothetical protein AB8O55_29875 [Saccharopolyspora cebuensis]|uniref:Uncharacterized protein n=3 Tax=Saccharopolyspora cebuensis TaxID=418759 RepID=A0ABV4CRB6_9PSEU
MPPPQQFGHPGQHHPGQHHPGQHQPGPPPGTQQFGPQPGGPRPGTPPQGTPPPGYGGPPPEHQAGAYPRTSMQAPVGGGAPRTGITPLGWALRGAGLVAISVVSGLIWLAFQPAGPSDEEQQAAPPPQPEYRHEKILSEDGFQGCELVSTDQIAEFFRDNECNHLTRALYRSYLPSGEPVLTSVITVRMPDIAQARRLNEVITRDGTGNVRDLVDDERAGTEDMPSLNDRGYWSEQQGELVVIGDSAYFDKPTKKGDEKLIDVTREMLKLGWPQDGQPN